MSGPPHIFDYSKRLEQEAIRVRERASQISRQKIRQNVAAGLGVVEVAGSGALLDVRLEPGAFQRMRPDVVAGYIVEALAAAEARAASLRGTIREEAAWRLARGSVE